MVDYQTAVAKSLLDIAAIKLQPNDPFTWASGIKSPIYTDNRKTISFPDARRIIIDGLAALIKEQYPNVEVIGGVATAGIPHAAWVAEKLDLPMIYVRSKPKDHGTGKQIEGVLAAGQKVVLIDDLISTGGSVLGAVKATQAAGGEVLGVAAIFSYELPAATINFAQAATPFSSLTNFSSLIQVAQKTGEITADELMMIANWHRTLE
ncbi:orotate phosphoribosyltransferase [Weissella paramesenteroides]|uniref:orotate phosphoribosyltransferase n=1 Tax=Weissella paramesenteroides TaxID=1249 RepID=UPI001239D436|nr:orotate phosphoribosyltransferase [Weissella paramesenteroides]KAA8442034.1 orotate phosphoribosyltransferase [Weissella paramesenteroides]KAA8442278.1 orotate phosphoribosyltransferase [Weissella paramesenteroides]KAA8443671.1 orotate phosphoribosyltransferase [Weissella paramesenteroides]KAA8447173.1 orotate phosphoribosyltransferase [Weissella paramesenteroides]KAA8450162.1 orotate phosphoribosyltransferase [Weissella paramesenteroides]